MRLRDILPDKESLVTRDYWKKRNLLGFTPQDEAVAAEPRAEAQRKPAQTNIEPSTEINWSYAVIERQNPKDLATELIPFHPGKLILENDANVAAFNAGYNFGETTELFAHRVEVKAAPAEPGWSRARRARQGRGGREGCARAASGRAGAGDA